MSHRRTYQVFITVFAMLFISLQSFALGHSAAYDDAPHEHNGIACDISVLTSDDIAVTPVPPSFKTPVSETVLEANTPFTSARYLRPIVRGPPPRSPPHS